LNAIHLRPMSFPCIRFFQWTLAVGRVEFRRLMRIHIIG
jgi:hypothetical protein